MSYFEYTGPESFHWSTDLSRERREAITAWAATLSDDERSMISDMIRDANHQGWEDGAAESIGEDM